MPPILLPIELSDLDVMKALQVKNHASWPAVFSTNSDREIWCFSHFGKTPRNRRIFVEGELPAIEQIAEIYRRERPEGGRFFISDAGVFYTEECDKETQFIEFQLVD
jgi:hypothetical protein